MFLEGEVVSIRDMLVSVIFNEVIAFLFFL
jgi:hypothetical protein